MPRGVPFFDTRRNFLSESLGEAAHYVARKVDPRTIVGNVEGLDGCLLGILLIAAEWFQRDKQHALQTPHNGRLRNRWVRGALYVAIVCITLIFRGDQQTFIFSQS